VEVGVVRQVIMGQTLAMGWRRGSGRRTVRSSVVLVAAFVCTLFIVVVLAGCGRGGLQAGSTGTSVVPQVGNAKRVLVLCSFDPGYRWTDNMLAGINAEFAKSAVPIDASLMFMDMKRITYSDEYFARYRDLLRSGYRGVRFDALLACDNDAFQFLRRYRDELFPGVPLVFASLNDYDPALLDGRKDLTGTSENTDYRGTIDIALRLLPATRTIVVVTDGSTTGLAHRSAVGKIEAEYGGRVTFRYLSLADYDLEGLAAELAALGRDSVVLLLQHFIDRDGRSWTVDQSTPLLTARSAVPCFVLTDIRMGLGAIGGHVVSGEAHGSEAARMVVEILQGKPVAAIPVLLDSPNRYLFDWRVLGRFGIAASGLPAGSVVTNRPTSLLEQYRAEVIAALIVFVLLLAFLTLMGLEILRRRRVERRLGQALAEKDTLLRELYHRTKNNMNVISSLLWLQADTAEGRNPKDLLEEMRTRIHAMALVHEKLYQSRNLTYISFAEYLHDLVPVLRQTYRSGEGVEIESACDEIDVSIDIAIPCGLLLNELVCNAFRHAFPAGGAGKVRVSARWAEGLVPQGGPVLQGGPVPQGGRKILLRVADDGPGFPTGFDPRRDGGLGMQIVFAIAENQLRGTVVFDSVQGLSCTISFDDDLYGPRV
jgi:two-component sensor histidine kinase